VLLRLLCEFLESWGYKPAIIEANMFYNVYFPKHTVENISKRLGIADFAKVINLSKDERVRYVFDGKDFEIPKMLDDSSQYFLINVPHLNVHPIFTFTGAIKNIYGCYPEADKLKQFHMENGIQRSIIAIHHFIRPDYTIMDAIKAQDRIHDFLKEKERGYYYPYGYLFASTNPLCIDLLILKLLGKKEDRVFKSLEEIYQTTYTVMMEYPASLRDFKTSGRLRKFIFENITEIPYSESKYLREGMRRVLMEYVHNKKYLYDQAIFRDGSQ